LIFAQGVKAVAGFPSTSVFESQNVLGMINGRSAYMMSIACPSTSWSWCYDAFFSEAYAVNTGNSYLIMMFKLLYGYVVKSYMQTTPVPMRYAPMSSQFDKHDALIPTPLPSDVIDITFASSIGPFCIMQSCA
jgi:hypothetical protein